MGNTLGPRQALEAARKSGLLKNSGFPVVTEEAAKEMDLRIQGHTDNTTGTPNETYEEWTEKAVHSSLSAPNCGLARGSVMNPPPCKKCGMICSITEAIREIETEMVDEGLLPRR